MPFVSSHSRDSAVPRSRQLSPLSLIIVQSLALQVSDLAKDLYRAVRVRELRKQFLITLETAHRMREQPRKPAGIFGLRLCQVLHAELEVFAVCIHGSDHHFVAQ